MRTIGGRLSWSLREGMSRHSSLPVKGVSRFLGLGNLTVPKGRMAVLSAGRRTALLRLVLFFIQHA